MRMRGNRAPLVSTARASAWQGPQYVGTQEDEHDADGKFHFEAKAGSYAIVAAASRLVGDTSEVYYWFVAAPKAGTIHLANDNTVGEDAAECLVKGLRGNPESVMAKHDGDWLAEFVRSQTHGK